MQFFTQSHICIVLILYLCEPWAQGEARRLLTDFAILSVNTPIIIYNLPRKLIGFPNRHFTRASIH